MNETNGTIQDYVRLSVDYDNIDRDVLVKEYYKTTKPHLSAEEIDFLLEDTFAFDDDIDEEREQGRQIAFGLGMEGKQVNKCVALIAKMYTAFLDLDASIVEINPLVVTADGDVLPLDAKMNFDDNAMFRQKEVEELRDVAEEDPAEKRAKDHELNYVKLTGNIGCMVNGAGLAMATMDIIKLYGGDPANFLDVGGGATKERVAEAFRIILSDPNVEGILVNIFGGIMRCDVIAEGVITAARELGLTMPLVVRLEGTNVDKGKKLLKESGLNIIAADNLADAAQKVVSTVKAEAA